MLRHRLSVVNFVVCFLVLLVLLFDCLVLDPLIEQGFYPVRERSRIATEFKALCHELICSKAFISCSGEVVCSFRFFN